MTFFSIKTKVAVAAISFFFIVIAFKALAVTPIEQACLRFADELWFTVKNSRINTPAKNCYWNNDSFKIRGVIVRTYMTISFWPDFWANPPSSEYLKKHLGEEIIGNSNYGDGDPQIGDEEENSISWSKLNEAPMGDYGIIHEYGSQWNSVETVDFYFMVNGCTVKIGGSAVPERQQDAEDLDYYDYLKQITTAKAGEIAEKLKNEPLCKIGNESSENVTESQNEELPEVEALAEKQPVPEDFSPGPSEEDAIPEELRKRFIAGPYYPASSFKNDPIHIRAVHVEGRPEVHFPDGKVIVLRENDYIEFPLGSKLITGPRTRIQASGFLWLEESSQMELKPWLPPTASPDLPPFATFEIQKGYGRFREQKTVLRKASATGVAPITRGTDFTIAFNPDTGITIVELYDGEIDVPSLGGETIKNLKTSYGNPIKRVEVAKNGVMTEQIAISQNEWQTRQTAQAELRNQPQENKGNGLSWVFLLILLSGGMFILHKKGEFRLIFQKVSGFVRKKNPIEP